VPPSFGSSLSRRQFLTAGTATAGAVLLGACGSGGDDAAPTTTTTASESLAMAQFFGGPMFVAGRELRAPFGLADQDGLLPLDRAPTRVEVQMLDPKGAPHGDPVTVARHADGLPRPYFPLVTTVDAPGIYTARLTLDGVGAEMAIQVHSADEVKVITSGTPMPALETPTLDDARGVSPICTRDPVCALHDVTVAQALATGSPTAVLVASPAFCQIAICGPVLDVLLDVTSDFPDVRFIHVEVYADPANDTETIVPAIAPLHLHFEPCLVLVGSDGVVADRVDTIYDRAEARDRLAALV